MMKCYRCNGKGQIKQVVSYFPDGEPDIDWDDCPECDGSGEVSKKEFPDEDF